MASNESSPPPGGFIRDDDPMLGKSAHDRAEGDPPFEEPLAKRQKIDSAPDVTSLDDDRLSTPPPEVLPPTPHSMRHARQGAESTSPPTGSALHLYNAEPSTSSFLSRIAPMPDSPRPGATVNSHAGGPMPSQQGSARETSPQASTSGARQASPSTSSPLSATSSASSNNSNSADEQLARRVKVYRLKGQNEGWEDLGTGWCVIYTESLPKSNPPAGSSLGAPPEYDIEDDDGPWLVVKPETQATNGDDGMSRDIWKSGMRSILSAGGDRGSYQLQQDTLIVWTENDGTDMALSFATEAGCAEIWNFIERLRNFLLDHAQGFLSDPASSPTPSTSSPTMGGSILQAFHAGGLPEPNLGNLKDIDIMIKWAGRTPLGREKLAGSITKTGFIRKLIQVMREAEDLESVIDLHCLCIIMQSILLLNDTGIFEYILLEDVFFGVVGVLEYDPEFPTMKASYRDHLTDPNRFKEVVPIRKPTIKAKIHQTYRLQYLRDVILARILDDATFSMLNSLIYYHQVDIVTHLQNNQHFLTELFAIFGVEFGAKIGPQTRAKQAATFIGPIVPPSSSQTNGEEAVDPAQRQKQKDAILFLQQFCIMAKNLQAGARHQFYRALADRGLYRVLEFALEHLAEDLMKIATVDLLMILIDHDPSGVRAYCLLQHEAGKRTLVVFLIELFLAEEELGIKAQMAEAIKILVQTQPDPHELTAQSLQRHKLNSEDPEAEKFLQFFYDHCITILLQPILDLPNPRDLDDGLLPLSTSKAALCSHLCDHLCYFVAAHTFRSKYFILSTTVSVSVSYLMRTKLKHLRLAAVRYVKACVNKTDEFYFRYLIKNDLFLPILNLAREEQSKDNLILSACLDFFEFIRQGNVKAVLNHLMDRYGDRVRQLAEILPTFAQIILKWEANNEPPPAPTVTAEEPPAHIAPGPAIGAWAGERILDADEESYFNESDDEDDALKSGKANATKDTIAPSVPPIANVKVIESTPFKDQSEPAGKGIVRSPAVIFKEMREKTKTLVDYGDDDEETKAPLANDTAPPPPPGELKRRRDDEEEEALGLLGGGPAAKRLAERPKLERPLSNGSSKLTISFGKK